MSAEELHAAARLMRERAERGGLGPWSVEQDWDTGEMFIVGDRKRYVATVHEWSQALGNPAHIASWHPAVALAVADWLDHEALCCESTMSSPSFSPPPAALAVARAYLGES